MRPIGPVRALARVLRRGHGLLLGLALLLPGGAVGIAQEGTKGKSAEEKAFEALGAEWKAGKTDAVAARFPAKGRVSLSLPGAQAGEYRAEQGKSVLATYFGARTFAKVELKSCKASTGTFDLEYTRTSDRKKVTAHLVVTLGTEEKRRVLESARETP